MIAVISLLVAWAGNLMAGQPARAGVDGPHVPRATPVTPVRKSISLFAPNPLVAEMIGQVRQDDLYQGVATLSGEQATLIGGQPYTLTTRHTDSGQPIAKATQYVYEWFGERGLSPQYVPWISGAHSGRNVAGVLTGTMRPGEVVIIGAHLDSLSPDALVNAPGADDNATGSAAVLAAADIFSAYRFERTVRFVLFTGEEQWLLGSQSYAQAARARGENIVAVYNMDMLGYEDAGGPVVELHTRTLSDTGYSADLAIVNVFTSVVATYGLVRQLTPEHVADNMKLSDHASFWNVSYPAILAIEDWQGDFNPNLHKTSDRISALDMAYYTSFVKASLGTVAHLAGPLGKRRMFVPVIVEW
jgi:hypothetical protein